MNAMAEERPKWPESLPPPVEFTEGDPRVDLAPHELGADDAIKDLVHDLYWFPDSEYFVYFLIRRRNRAGTRCATRGVGDRKKKDRDVLLQAP